MSSVKRRSALHPAWFILGLTLSAYGLLLPFTGFYWDDWPFAWIARFLGPAEFTPAFAPFRPFLGPIFHVTTSLIPAEPFYWQAFALVIRFLAGLSTWWTFRQIWPDRPRLAQTVSLILTVFPGYSQHWVAFTHINQEWIPFLFLVLSIGFTFRGLRSPKPGLDTAIAVLMQICGLFPTEYFFGLEGIRGMLLYQRASGGPLARLRAAMRAWWPYLVVWFVNGLWLVYYYRFGPYNSYEVTASAEASGLNLILQALDTLWKVCIYIWVQIFVLLGENPGAPSSLLTAGLIAAACLVLARTLPAGGEEPADRGFGAALMLIGLAGILLGRLPSLAADLPLRLQSSYDRFMVSMMPGGSLFAAGLLQQIPGDARLRRIALALVLSLGVGQQFFNANIFRRDWERQGEIYRELAWRIPGLEPDTLLLTYQMPIDYETDLSFTAPINWMYAPQVTPPHLPYALLYTEKRLGGSTLPSLDPGVAVRFPYRTMEFHGSTSQVVVLFKPENGCLRVLDPVRRDQEIYAGEPEQLRQAIRLSSPDHILPAPQIRAAPPFHGVEDGASWCYHFTRAELAYQTGDLPRVVSLFGEAEGLGYSPEDPREWLILIEAHARMDDLAEAQALSERILAADPKMRRAVCVVWRRLTEEDLLPNGAGGRRILDELHCD